MKTVREVVALGIIASCELCWDNDSYQEDYCVFMLVSFESVVFINQDCVRGAGSETF